MLTEPFDTAFAALPIGVAFLSRDGVVLRANPALAALTGQPATALGGLPAARCYADPAAFDALLATLAAAGSASEVILALARPDGSAGHVSHAAAAVDESRFGVPGFLVTLTPVDALVAANRALTRAELDYEPYFEHATEGIYRSSLDGHQLRANPALVRLNGYETEAELMAAVGDIGKEWYVDPERRAEFQRQLQEDGRVEDFESEIYRHKTRERIWVSENARLVRDETGKPLYYEGTVRDVSAKRRVEDKLRAAIREAQNSSLAKSEFLANMSHELRTPLNAILGFSSIMLSGTFGPIGNPRYETYIKDVNDSASLLLQLIEDILDVSKADTGKLKLDEGPVDLAELLARAQLTLAERARKTQITVESAVLSDLPAVRGDAKRLRQIFLNLLSNAIKFSPPGGHVMVKAGVDAEGAMIVRIRDNGPGIPEEDLPRIFEPFVQLESIMHRSRDGAGLGLPLCRSLAEAHGGSLQLISAPGEGTEAVVRLPPERVIRTAIFALAFAAHG